LRAFSSLLIPSVKKQGRRHFHSLLVLCHLSFKEFHISKNGGQKSSGVVSGQNTESQSIYGVYGVVKRMKKSLIASLIVIAIAASTAATVCGDKSSLSGLRLLDLEGNSVNPFADSGAKAVVFIFTRYDCPISNRYAPEMRRLSALFAPEKVKFWLVYPDADAQPGAIRRHIKEYDYNCEALRDPGHELVKETGVSVTPEAAVFVFNRSGARMIYRGRIDDRYAAFGKYRPAPSVRDLEDVLSAAIKGAPVEFKATPAVGCYISDLK
jgi:hypothetical protein